MTFKLDNGEGKKCPMKPIQFPGKIREFLRLEIYKIRSGRHLSGTTWIILPGVRGNGLHDAVWTILALQLSDVQVPSQRSRQWECKLSTSSSCFFRPDLCVCFNAQEGLLLESSLCRGVTKYGDQEATGVRGKVGTGARKTLFQI